MSIVDPPIWWSLFALRVPGSPYRPRFVVAVAVRCRAGNPDANRVDTAPKPPTGLFNMRARVVYAHHRTRARRGRSRHDILLHRTGMFSASADVTSLFPAGCGFPPAAAAEPFGLLGCRHPFLCHVCVTAAAWARSFYLDTFSPAAYDERRSSPSVMCGDRPNRSGCRSGGGRLRVCHRCRNVWGSTGMEPCSGGIAPPACGAALREASLPSCTARPTPMTPHARCDRLRTPAAWSGGARGGRGPRSCCATAPGKCSPGRDWRIP